MVQTIQTNAFSTSAESTNASISTESAKPTIAEIPKRLPFEFAAEASQLESLGVCKPQKIAALLQRTKGNVEVVKAYLVAKKNFQDACHKHVSKEDRFHRKLEKKEAKAARKLAKCARIHALADTDRLDKKAKRDAKKLLKEAKKDGKKCARHTKKHDHSAKEHKHSRKEHADKTENLESMELQQPMESTDSVEQPENTVDLSVIGVAWPNISNLYLGNLIRLSHLTEV
jgi:hypothetical protein